MSAFSFAALREHQQDGEATSLVTRQTGAQICGVQHGVDKQCRCFLVVDLIVRMIVSKVTLRQHDLRHIAQRLDSGIGAIRFPVRFLKALDFRVVKRAIAALIFECLSVRRADILIRDHSAKRVKDRVISGADSPSKVRRRRVFAQQAEGVIEKVVRIHAAANGVSAPALSNTYRWGNSSSDKARTSASLAPRYISISSRGAYRSIWQYMKISGSPSASSVRRASIFSIDRPGKWRWTAARARSKTASIDLMTRTAT